MAERFAAYFWDGGLDQYLEENVLKQYGMEQQTRSDKLKQSNNVIYSLKMQVLLKNTINYVIK